MTQNKSRAQVFLEEIQRDVYKDRNLWLNEFKTRSEQQRAQLRKNPFCIYLEEDLSRLSPEQLKFYSYKLKSDLDKKYVEVPTEYEDPLTYNIMMELSRDIKSVAPKKIDDSRVQFGTLPLGPVEALHIAVPDSTEHLIILESELFYFCNMISKVISTACPIREITYKPTAAGTKERWISYSLDLKDVENNLNMNGAVLKHFIEIFLAYLIYGSVTKAPGYIVPEEYFRPYVSFRHGMELFAMGHEYAHILSGHLNIDQYIERNIAGHKVKEIPHTWAMELLADATGAMMMIDAMFKNYRVDISLSYADTELFLQSLSLLERATKITKNESPMDDGTHPPLMRRRDELRGFMKKIYGDDVQPSLDFASKVENVVELLWNKIEPNLYGYYRMKMELMPAQSDWRWI